MTTNDPTCKERVASHLKSRIEDLQALWTSYQNGEEETEDLGSIFEYGLSFDYCTAEGRNRGYFRYQLSWGGPSDEFRIFAEGHDYKWHVDRIEYWFMDWFDGAKRTLSGKRYELLEEIFLNLFVEVGSAQAEFEKAQDYDN